MDIFNPEVSQVVKGIQGKLLLIYGTNSTGKTKNCAQAEKPLFCCFENGLNAIAGVKKVTINKWNDWTKMVKQLTNDDTIAKAKELYSTIVIDTAEGMGDLAADFVCGSFGVNRIAEGNRGYGLWKEYSAEIQKWLKKLTNAGYTIIFLGHEGEREFLDAKGEKYTKLYPRGDKRVVDPICDLVDIIGYAQVQPNTPDNKEVKSTLYLKGTPAYHARSRFDYIVTTIPEWDLTKLNKAIVDAIDAEEKASGTKAITLQEAQKIEKAKAAEEEKTKQPIEELINIIGNKLKAMNAKEGNIARYNEVMQKCLGTVEFSAQQATEANRQQLELLIEGLTAIGY